MPADQPRTRTVGCKMTDSEYERLSAVAEGDGMTLGEWVREVLLERADGRKGRVPQVSVSHLGLLTWHSSAGLRPSSAHRIVRP
jgi:hypothetical protein